MMNLSKHNDQEQGIKYGGITSMAVIGGTLGGMYQDPTTAHLLSVSWEGMLHVVIYAVISTAAGYGFQALNRKLFPKRKKPG